MNLNRSADNVGKAPARSALTSIPLLRNGYALILNSAGTSAIGFGFWILAAHRYTPNQVGVGSATISSMLFISAFAQLNLLGFLSRFLPVAGERTRSLIWRCYGTTSTISVVAAGSFMIVQRTMDKPLLPTGLGFSAYFVFATVCWTIFSLQDGIMAGLRNATWVPVENVLFGIGKIVFVLAFASIFGTSGIFAGWTLAMFLSIPPVNYYIFHRLIDRHVAAVRTRPLSLTGREVLGFVSGDYLGSIFAQASTVLLPLLMSRWVGARLAAFFAITWVIATSIDLVAFNLTTSLTVEGALEPDALGRLVRDVLRHMMRIVLPIAAALLLGAPLLLRLFGDSYADQGTPLLRLMAVACIPRGLNAIAIGVCRVRQRVGRIVAIQGVTFLFVVGLGQVLVHHVGLAGIGIAWLISQLLIAVAWLPDLRRLLSQPT